MELILNNSQYVSDKSALFGTFVAKGEEKAHVTLPFNLRLFLIECLSEHMADPEIVHHVLAFEYFDTCKETGAVRALRLKRAGDSALLLAGLFPERALRLRVSPKYFSHMGQGFYATLASHLLVSSPHKHGELYNEVAHAFSLLARVLRDARGYAGNEWDAFVRFKAEVV
jgi:hypothetical protein